MILGNIHFDDLWEKYDLVKNIIKLFAPPETNKVASFYLLYQRSSKRTSHMIYTKDRQGQQTLKLSINSNVWLTSLIQEYYFKTKTPIDR